MSGTDFGQIGGRKPFSVPDTFSVRVPKVIQATASGWTWRITQVSFNKTPETGGGYPGRSSALRSQTRDITRPSKDHWPQASGLPDYPADSDSVEVVVEGQDSARPDRWPEGSEVSHHAIITVIPVDKRRDRSGSANRPHRCGDYSS